jgi:predicted NUDIX family NTP pyrophosphohydrolase
VSAGIASVRDETFQRSILDAQNPVLASNLQSNTFEMEWPPRSGRRQSFSELDRASWFGIAEARLKILKGQAVFLDYLLETLGWAEGS